MKTRTNFTLVGSVVIGPLLFMSAAAFAQEGPSECVVQGALAFDSWISEDAGGSGFPDGETDNDYLRCKSCHGWDQLGTDGGYVRRSRNAGRPNAGAGDVDQTSRDISYTTREGAPVTAEMIIQAGTGRSLEDGSGSWVALDDPASPANKAAYAAGYTLGNQHPDFSTGGDNALTQEQADCIAEFLNFEDAGWDAYFEEINPNTDPVLYTIRSDADADRVETFFTPTSVSHATAIRQRWATHSLSRGMKAFWNSSLTPLTSANSTTRSAGGIRILS